jgi:hypothetical protein
MLSDGTAIGNTTYWDGSQWVVSSSNIYNAGANIGINTAVPDTSAKLDIVSESSGLLIPRMTTTQRNAIPSPVESLLIYNTTTQCYEGYNATTQSWVAFGCIGCQLPGGFSASAGSALTGTSFSANWTASAGATTYYLDVSSVSSFTSFVAGYNNLNAGNVTTYSVTGLTCGTYYYRIRANNACGTGSNSNVISVTLSGAPTTANAGADITPACGVTTATLAGNTPTVGTGAWSVISGTATITTPSSPTSGVTGLAVPGTATLRWTITNNPCGTSTDDVVITTSSCCAGSLTINHTIGTVAPETKSVTYGVVSTNLSGSTKCWITRNLGATNQGSSATDNTDAAAGWYWQFNLKQGYKVGPTPAWTVTDINQNSNWVAAQDPCTIELGAGWRIPTGTEWTNADANGSWANYTNAYSSVLKLHAGGLLRTSDGLLQNRGANGYFYSSTQNNDREGVYLDIRSGGSNMAQAKNKPEAMTLRCIKD